MAATVTIAFSPELAQQIADEATKADVTPLQEAGIFRALATLGFTKDEIGGMTGRKAAYVGGRLSLFGLIQRGQDALNAGQLPVNLAGYIAQLGPAGQEAILDCWVGGEFGGARQAERHVRAMLAGGAAG
ncbi:hypothetical protein ABZ499_32855 [Streptomyces sp. NPDC019990]|uniref:hypothetical protein n=1 Tax=Streptomyces sp. NPDC019990 TaxID=3154693 RepID=UPI0033FD850C